MKKVVLSVIGLIVVGSAVVLYLGGRLREPPGDAHAIRADSSDSGLRQVSSVGAPTTANAGAREGLADRVRRVSREAEQLDRLRIAEDPELRELCMRETMREWMPFFAQAKMNREREDTLVKLLVEWTLATSMEDRAVVDGLIARVLEGDELGKFLAHRDEIPVRESVEQAMVLTEKSLGAAMDDSRKQAVDAVVRAAPLNRDSLWKEASDMLEAGRLSPAELPRIEARAMGKLEAALAAHGVQLVEAERAALRQWYRDRVLLPNMRALRNGLAARQ